MVGGHHAPTGMFITTITGDDSMLHVFTVFKSDMMYFIMPYVEVNILFWLNNQDAYSEGLAFKPRDGLHIISVVCDANVVMGWGRSTLQNKPLLPFLTRALIVFGSTVTQAQQRLTLVDDRRQEFEHVKSAYPLVNGK